MGKTKFKRIVHNFFVSFFSFFSILLILAFVVNSINYFQIILRSVIFSLILLFFLYLKEKFSEFFPFKFFTIFIILLLVTYFLSSYENLEKIDIILGIENFSEKIFRGEVKTFHLISTPLFYQRYKTVEETFEEKLKEFNNSVEYLELKIHEKVNKIRATFNLSLLNFDYKLREIARHHSRDMAEKNYFDHISPSGETLSDRFNRFNYSCKILVGNNVYEGSENLFLGYIYKKYFYDKLSGKIVGYEFYSLDEIVNITVHEWYNSEGHRRNMLFKYWRNEGIGIYIDNEGKIYVTQIFC